jgi:integrase
MNRVDAWRMIQRRAAELGVRIGCHTFRATGITAYLEAGGTLENCPHCRRDLSALSRAQIGSRASGRACRQQWRNIRRHNSLPQTLGSLHRNSGQSKHF